MTGEIAALSAALLWAFASIIFASIGAHVRAINLNIIKGLLACVIMVLVLAAGSLWGAAETHLSSVYSLSVRDLLLLAASGIIGIGIGDTAYFGCLRRIGPQKGLMLESTAPIIAALLALVFFSEFLHLLAWSGIALTTVGVIMVVRLSHSPLHYHNSFAGIALGLFAATSQAAGIVLSRMALAGGEVDPLASSLVRLGAGLLALATWLTIRRLLKLQARKQQSLTTAIRVIARHNLSRRMLIAVFIGTFCALWLQQISVKYTSAAVAQALLGACPLFGMLIGAFQGQKQPIAVWGGLVLGFAGVALLFIR